MLELNKLILNKWMGLFCFLGLLAFAPSAEARNIYVRLADGAARVAVTSDETMTLVDGAQKTHSIGKSATLAHSGTSAVIGKNKYPLPVRISGGLLGYNKRKYRGEFFITKEFVLINALNVEDYIRGVLPAEASARWPLEALKVQAIISRTYGLRQSLNRSERGYDVSDTTSDQVYRGAGVETAATDRAVRETAGEVLAYGDSLALTFYHSDSGGYTADNVHVWGRNVPYLRGVREPIDYESPHSSWTAKVSPSQMQAAMKKIGENVGQVREVRVTDFDSGGRVTSLTVVGSGGSASVKSETLRMALGANLLKSTLLTNGGANPFASVSSGQARPAGNNPPPGNSPVTASGPMIGNEETRLTNMTSEGVFTSAELLDMLLNPEKRKGYLQVGLERAAGGGGNKAPASSAPGNPSPSVVVRRSPFTITAENGSFVFHGRGWGHGVGLSQWGAMSLAKQGWKAERILEHYYPGPAVKRVQ